MQALVFYGTGDKRWERRPIPVIKHATDAIVRMERTTICGTDLHILKGYVPTVAHGRILGHEGIGTVISTGTGVSQFRPGDRVLISCISSCGKCENCKKGFYGHCEAEDGGWVLGNTCDGCQAEYVRIPHADGSLYAVPPEADLDSYVMLSDILPTGLEVGVLCGKIQPEQSVAIVGAGPVGLSSTIAAQLYSPTMLVVIDVDANRLNAAVSFGATHSVNNSDGNAAQKVMELTKGKGVDVVLECIGAPVGWDISEQIVAAGGNIAICGVHGKPVTLHLERMWKRNFSMTAGLVHTTTIPMLMKLVQSGRLKAHLLISHRFKLSEMMTAYETFGHAAQHNALKVILSNDLSK